MKLPDLLLTLFFVVLFNQTFQNSFLEGVSCDYAPSYEVKKKSDTSTPDSMTTSPYKYARDTYDYDTNEPLPVKVRHEYTCDEKSVKNKNINTNQKELSREEIEAIKLAGTKCKKQVKPISKPRNKVVKVEFAEEEFKCSPPPKTSSVFCAECEQCEMQVKANGEGVMLKCTDCHEVSSDEISFVGEGNRKILRLP